MRYINISKERIHPLEGRSLEKQLSWENLGHMFSRAVQGKRCPETGQEYIARGASMSHDGDEALGY